jgi:zinc-ribbon domain
MLTKIMSNATCPNCGAALIAGAKFCRQCGRLVGVANADGVTEATTRTLHAPTDYAAPPTDFFPSQPTSPAYISPKETPPPPAYDTKNLKAGGPKQSIWLMSAIASVLIVAGIALGIILFIRSFTSATRPSGAESKPPTVSVPGIPPPPQPPSVRTQTNSISHEFVYPGAEITMEMKNAEGGSILQLRTTDSYEKVLDWYVAKLKPQNTIISPGPSAVLKSDKLMAVINGAGGETHIMLKHLDEMDINIDLDR